MPLPKSFFSVSEAVSLALHAMAILAREQENRFKIREMHESLGGSFHHLAKVLQRLADARLIESAVGPGGGFRLAKPADEITLREIHEAVEGRMDEPSCLLARPACDGHHPCLLGELVQSIDRQVQEFLSQTTLADLARSGGGAELLSK